MALPQAVLFDMDGTLVDSEGYWMASEVELVSDFAGTWSIHDAKELIGKPLLVSAAIIRERTKIDIEPEEIVEQLLKRMVHRFQTQATPWMPGAPEVLDRFALHGIACALVSASYRILVDALVQGCPAGTFQATVCGDEVTKSKPAPDPYWKGAQLLGVDIKQCVVVEDSPPGVAAALASGAKAVAIPALITIPPQPGLSRLRCLDELTIGILERLMAGETIDTIAR